ncbi:MAG: MBL fold metallo-hydrolase [Chloroflexi bacterium]|nr:MBL fold metallo-hydrolase [Chloroflexota bacterium]
MSERAWADQATAPRPVCSESRAPYPSGNAEVRLRWLGVAGLEVAIDGQVLIIDPYLTRLPVWKVLRGRGRPDHQLVAAVIAECDYVLVTHPHWDHLMDVASVACRTGSYVYGSANACRLLTAQGVPAEQVREITAGVGLTLGSMSVDVIEAEHTALAGQSPLTGSLPSELRCPPRITDYRMDSAFSFLIDAGRFRILDWTSASVRGAVPADVLCVQLFRSRDFFEGLLTMVQPRAVVPVHWDDFFRPLSRPIRPLLPVGIRCTLAGFHYTDLDRLRQIVAEVLPTACVVVPEVLLPYNLERVLEGSV